MDAKKRLAKPRASKKVVMEAAPTIPKRKRFAEQLDVDSPNKKIKG